MAKHTVLKNVLHGEKDGSKKMYRKGQEIDLTKDQAEPLIAIGHVAPIEKAAK